MDRVQLHASHSYAFLPHNLVTRPLGQRINLHQATATVPGPAVHHVWQTPHQYCADMSLLCCVLLFQKISDKPEEVTEAKGCTMHIDYRDKATQMWFRPFMLQLDK
ncbi:hypothetical protein E2C01_011447 [Portunus trituberculatus]|uniref:Uncharacterized protein n=1 Tax=Portunus trituberculatus TaxID=210409 RepID=A0A5B7DBA5_PORTR|nr:hypothetical protein [Portunus trituberculatus]